LNTSVLTTPGNYSGTVTITATGYNTQTVNVNLVVSNLPAITATSLQPFTYTLGGKAPAAQMVTITGGSNLAFTAAASGGSWLSVTPTSGTTPGTLTVSVNITNLAPANYTGAIMVTSSGASNSPLSIPVTLTVSAAPITVSLSSTTLTFTANSNTAAPGSQTVTVTSTAPIGAPSPVSISTGGGTWLSTSLSTPESSVGNPAAITVAASPANLPAGTYIGIVLVTTPGAATPQQTIVVTFNVTVANLTAAPANLNFVYIAGTTYPPPVQSVKINCNQPITIAASVAGASWLTVTTSSSSTPTVLTASVNPASLPVGTYQAAISITSTTASNSPQIVPVTLVVSNKPMLAPSPSNLTFVATAGGSNPASQSINLSAGAAVPFTITASGNWLNVSPSSGTTPSTLMASVNPQGLSQGSYQGSITITSSWTANGPMIIPVTLNVAVPLAVTSAPAISSIVNAASYDMSGFSPGAIVSIFGNLLGPQTGASFALNSKGSLDSTVGGVSVTVNGAPAIPLFTQNGQINVILPFNIATSGEGNVLVTYNGLTSSQFNIPLTPSDVQLFTANTKGTGPGSILNQDFSVNSASNPAAKGSVVAVYGTGGGIVNPPVTAGEVAGDNLSVLALPFSAIVGGENAIVLYAGTAPGLVYGVYQFNVQLPADLPSGEQAIVLNVGDSASQSNVTVFVK